MHMHKTLSLALAAILFFVMAPVVAAQDAPAMDIVDIAASNEDFSTLVTAVQAAGLVDALKGEGPFTVFAPTNAAFEALPDGTLEALVADPSGDLTDILLYHVLGQKVMAADVTDGLQAPTLLGNTVKFSVSADGVKINDANIIVTDIEASNGVIHVIDAVILPPAGAEAAPTQLPVTGGSQTSLPLALAVAAGLIAVLFAGAALTRKGAVVRNDS
jgi:uncharacterized surface protein with fasciclin (FAS1) repeats